MTCLPDLTAHELLALFRSGEASPVEAIDQVARRIEEVDRPLGAFTTLCLDRAGQEARLCERAYRTGARAGLLAGVPLGVKDLFDSEDVRTTYGSPMFAQHVPSHDAEALRRARRAGAILVGKTQTDEFAWGITSVNDLMGTSRNPWSPELISGGSSGGSAVAVATHQVPLAIGSDTGGSIRVPAGFCGIVGFKPTYGRISTAGVWPLARTLDHPGPMASTPRDAGLLLRSIAGYDPADPATEEMPLVESGTGWAGALQGVRVGTCPDLHGVPLDADVQAVFDAALATIASCGATLCEVRIPEAAGAFACFATIQRAEALFTHTEAGLYPARAGEYGEDVRARLEVATQETTRDYLRASAQRSRLRAGFARAFREVELLLSPTAACKPMAIGERRVLHLGEQRDFRELVMTYTTPQDLIGLPACAMRGGFDSSGVPVGVQLTGRPWGDMAVLAAAQAFFDATPGIQAVRPPVGGDADRRTRQMSGPQGRDDRRTEAVGGSA